MKLDIGRKWSRLFRCIVILCLGLSFSGACQPSASPPQFAKKLSADQVAVYKSKLEDFRTTLEADWRLYSDSELQKDNSQGDVKKALQKASVRTAEFQLRFRKLTEAWLNDSGSMLATHMLVREVREAAISDWLTTTVNLFEHASRPDKTGGLDMPAIMKRSKERLALSQEMVEYEEALAEWYDKLGNPGPSK